MKNQTKIVAEPGKQEFFIIREFDAPRELVFRAFSTVDLLEQFFAPKNRITKYEYFHYHDNGSYKYTTSDENGRVLCVFKGAVHEVAAPERIILTSEMEGLPVKGHVVMEVMSFESIDGDRTRLSMHDVCLNVQDRDMIIGSGMEGGLKDIFEQLDGLLVEQLKS